MHKLHCILINLELCPPEEDFNKLADKARNLALLATETFYDRVYDYRSEDIGLVAEGENFPHGGVILGCEHPNLFIKTLEEWKTKPLQAALESLPRSAKPVTITDNLPEIVKQVWESLDGDSDSDREMRNLAYNLIQAFQLAYGKYLFDSQFYSAPDYSARISSKTLRDIKEHPERYALVFLDYHY